jgi:hypothetical protein
MALTEKLMILITGDASGAIGEMKKLAGEAEKNFGKAGGDVSKFSATATKVGAGMVAVGTGLLATAISAASTTTELGREVSKLQRYTGINAESASKLAYSAKMSGVGVDDLAVGIGKLSKAMANSPDKLTKFGIEAKTADGKLRTMTDVLGDVADRFKKMGPGTEATAASLDLFGKSGANLLPFLLKGKDGIQELSDEAEKMGLVLSQDNVDAVKKNIVAQRELSAAVNGAKVQIGNEMLPILTKFAELMTGIPGPLRDVIGPIVVLGGAVLVTGGAFLLAAGQIQKAKTSFANMSGAAQTGTQVLGIVAAAATVAMTAYSLMQGSMDRAKASQAELNTALLNDALAGGLPAMQQAIAETDAKIKGTFDATGGKSAAGAVWNFLTRKDPWNAFSDAGKLEGLIEGRNNMGTLTAASIALMDITGKSQEEMMAWIATQVNAGIVIPDVATAVAMYTGKIDANTLGVENAATAQDGYADSIRNAANALKATTSPYFAVLDAQGNLTEATKKYNEASANGTRRTAESDAAYLEMTKSAFALTDAQGALGAAQADGTASTASFNAAMETLRKQNIDPSTEAGKALIEKIYGVGYGAALVSAMLRDNPINPVVQQAQIDAFIANLGEIKAEYRRTWELIHGNPLTGDRPGVGVWRQTSASGGYLPAGRPTLVGELGPELFIPSSSGTVMTSLSTSHALSGGGAGVTIQNLTVALPNVTNGDQLVDELQRYIRRNGPLPLAVA